jgi:hypothetical protein
MSGIDWTERIPAPAAHTINTGLSPASPRTLERLLGLPRSTFTSECAPVTNPALIRRIVTESVGLFRVTGERLAVESLRRVLTKARAQHPDLYALVGTAGMLCARLVRGSAVVPSSHSWGTAIDLTVGGKLDIRGDGMVQRGLLALYPYFHAEGWFWGAEFRTEDGMHFEVAEETLKEWYG